MRIWHSKLGRLWPIRGAAAAFSLLGFLPNFIPFSQLDFLAGLHAVLIGWEETMRGIGMLLGWMLWVPELPTVIVKFFVLYFAIAPALSAATMKSETWTDRDSRRFLRWYYVSMLFTGTFLIFDGGSFFVEGGSNFWRAVGLIFVLLAFWYSFFRLQPYRNGVLFALGFVLTCEALYLLHAPVIRDAFETYVCSRAPITPERCSNDT